MFMYILYYTK